VTLVTTTIEILKSIRPELRWVPVQGEFTTDFLARKSAEWRLKPGALDPVVLEAQRILGRCTPPTDLNGSDTGLVVGYVQSGKTLSFTTVMSLARDNGYQLVILIAGTAVNLKSQSERRLFDDLGLKEAGRAWTHLENPGPNDKERLRDALEAFHNARVPDYKKRTVLITVLKNHTRLKNLVNVMGKLDLSRVPALIIDDEGDQASLNTKARDNKNNNTNELSATYDWVTQLKAVLPHHTFIQYTATPQANLLLEIADVLAPSFAELVTPGKGYFGGKELFASKPALVEVIPAKDIPSPTNVLTSPPKSLLDALKYFLLGAAVHVCLRQKGNRSMMIHPSQRTAPHADYRQWVSDTLDAWKQYLELDSNEDAFKACAALFEPQYRSLQQTFPTIPPLAELLEAMSAVFLDTRVVEVNSSAQGQRDVVWHANEYWVLIGGQKLDRGFTVEGLTVTYMPRPMGTGYADTLQQRARFYGYKENYKGLCRVFVLTDVRDALRDYVEHEEFVRDALEKFRGKPLAEWRRDFILTRALSPTRPSVISRDIKKVAIDEGWETPGALFRNEDAVKKNRDVISLVIPDWRARFGEVDAAIHPQFKDRRANSPRNLLIEGVPLREALEKILLPFRITDPKDSVKHTAALLALSESLKRRPDELCDVFLIGELKAQTRALVGGRINQVFSGKSPNTNDFNALNYVGDHALHSSERPSLHVRTFNLTLDAVSVSVDVPWYAIYFPAEFTKDSVIEDKPK
jgi:hypothetical protein